MPYSNEPTNKASHADIIRNPDIAAFLNGCDYLKIPSDEEAKELVARFVTPPPFDGVALPEHVLAVDGSYYESSIDDRLPSTKVGYVKIGCLLIDMSQFKSLRPLGANMVDPFRVARLLDSNSPLTFPLPSANILWKGKSSVRDSFRAAVDDHLSKARIVEGKPETSLRSMVFNLASRRPGNMATSSSSTLKIHKCPNCDAPAVEVRNVEHAQYCPVCGEEVYPSDVLRLWEEVADFQSNVQALSRFMLQVEHLVPLNYIRYLLDVSPPSLGALAFFVDGPLAIFGNSAGWMSRAIMSFLGEANARLKSHGTSQLVVIGLQKTGQVVDHVSLITRFLSDNRIYAIDDDYRYKYILSRDPSGNGFGDETYYGQDFIYKTRTGREFVFALPYPFATKALTSEAFHVVKADIGRYADLPRALTLIDHFECDLYENAVVPIALAHRYTAISLVPGGRALDILTRAALTSPV